MSRRQVEKECDYKAQQHFSMLVPSMHLCVFSPLNIWEGPVITQSMCLLSRGSQVLKCAFKKDRICAQWLPFLPSFLPQLIFHHFNISLYFYPTSSPLLSQEETELLISKVMTPSLLISSRGPNINKHTCEWVCLLYPCLHHVTILNILVHILLYFLSV